AREPGGYVLLVESARIDHAHHAGNAYRALDETIALSRAVEAALEATSARDTLIVVTADHSHTLSFAGYPARGNPILGTVRGRLSAAGHEDAQMLDKLGLPYTTLSYANGAGYVGESATQPAGPKRLPHTPGRYAPATGRPDLRGVDTTHPDYLQEALVPLHDETHGGEDVGVWARGPGSAAFRGTLEQNVLYHLIVQATPRLRERLCAAGTCDADGVPVHLPDPADFPDCTPRRLSARRTPAGTPRAAQPPRARVRCCSTTPGRSCASRWPRAGAAGPGAGPRARAAASPAPATPPGRGRPSPRSS